MIKDFLFMFLFFVFTGCNGVKQEVITINEVDSFKDSKLIEAIIEVESGGNPLAYNKRSGATGLGQLIPSTYRRLGFTKVEMFVPHLNRKAINLHLEEAPFLPKKVTKVEIFSIK